MFHELLQVFNSTTSMLLRYWKRGSLQRSFFFILVATLLSSFVQPSFYHFEAYSAELKMKKCMLYTVRSGDTLNTIATKKLTNVLTLAKANGIANNNLLLVGHSLCISQAAKSVVEKTPDQESAKYVPHVVSAGFVRRYADKSLENSTYQQVNTLLRRAAAYYHIPANLVLAIARKESNFRQHVIAKDGGVGVMQIMPNTATWLNKMAGTTRDPYKLQDNIFLGVFYLHLLGDSFHWNMPKVISAYNEGSWAVARDGIFNWSYVNHVMAMIRNSH